MIKSLAYNRSINYVWSDLILAMACSISSFSTSSEEILKKREKMFDKCIERIGNSEIAIKIFSLIMEELSENPKQDLLGTIYYDLNLINKSLGQFFTPYSVSELMAKCTLSDAKDKYQKQGYLTVSDSTCGAGATLLAASNFLLEQNISLRNDVLFFAQDIDMVAGLMCYIQLFIVGARGMVVIGDSLSKPISEKSLNEVGNNENVWLIP